MELVGTGAAAAAVVVVAKEDGVVAVSEDAEHCTAEQLALTELLEDEVRLAHGKRPEFRRLDLKFRKSSISTNLGLIKSHRVDSLFIGTVKRH